MRTEADTPTDQRFLMILGQLSTDMVLQLEEGMPQWVQRLRDRGDDSALAECDRFSQRNRTDDLAYYALYAYADIPLGRTYDCIFQKYDDRAFEVDCKVEYAFFEGWFPSLQIDHGHKHILFMKFDGPTPDYIPRYESWDDIGRADWKYGFCDISAYDAIQARLAGEQEFSPDEPET